MIIMTPHLAIDTVRVTIATTDSTPRDAIVAALTGITTMIGTGTTPVTEPSVRLGDLEARASVVIVPGVDPGLGVSHQRRRSICSQC